MHTTIIDPVIRARYQALKGGREFAFTRIETYRTALLVIDMQNGFVEEGALLEVPAARHAGGLSVFFRFTTTSADDWPVYFQDFQNAEFAQSEVQTFQHGSHGHALIPQLDIGPDDLVLDKSRFSAFTPGASDALETLKRRGIDTLFISGTLSDCCCGATARDAQQLGFKVIFIADANAALSDAEHNSTVNALAAWFADIRTTEQALTLIQGD
jgi:ureidoacrylate peracid hydrolase